MIPFFLAIVTSSEEFSFFIPTLINYKFISKQAKNIIQFRKTKLTKDKKRFINDFLKDFYEAKSLTEVQINTLFDYGDNAMRYFRLTKYFRVRKQPLGNWVIELEPSRSEEIKQLLVKYDGSALEFKTSEEYIKYLSNIKKPELPWEVNNSKLKEIACSLRNIVKDDYNNLEINGVKINGINGVRINGVRTQ